MKKAKDPGEKTSFSLLDFQMWFLSSKDIIAG